MGVFASGTWHYPCSTGRQCLTCTASPARVRGGERRSDGDDDRPNHTGRRHRARRRFPSRGRDGDEYRYQRSPVDDFSRRQRHTARSRGRTASGHSAYASATRWRARFRAARRRRSADQHPRNRRLDRSSTTTRDTWGAQPHLRGFLEARHRTRSVTLLFLPEQRLEISAGIPPSYGTCRGCTPATPCHGMSHRAERVVLAEVRAILVEHALRLWLHALVVRSRVAE